MDTENEEKKILENWLQPVRPKYYTYLSNSLFFLVMDPSLYWNWRGNFFKYFVNYAVNCSQTFFAMVHKNRTPFNQHSHSVSESE